MKMIEDSVYGNLITSYTSDKIYINRIAYQNSLILTPEKIIADLSEHSLECILKNDWQTLLMDTPDIVIIGTGHKQKFLTAALLAPFYEKQMGVEVMTTASACRTYNILASEKRKVAALLIIEKGLSH